MLDGPVLTAVGVLSAGGNDLRFLAGVDGSTPFVERVSRNVLVDALDRKDAWVEMVSRDRSEAA